LQQATKTTLVGLARSLDANKAVFCLNSLAREEVDTDFDEVLGELIHGLSSLRSVDIQSSGDVLDAGLRELIKSAGLERYAQAIARQTDLAAPHVSLLVGPARALWGADSPVTALFEIAKLPELENNTIAWLASHAASDTNVRTDLILPLLERYGHDLSGGETLANAANAFLAHPEGMETLRTILHQGSGGHVAGVLILLGQAGDPQDIALVGPFIEDFARGSVSPGLC
jgi:hypothetical protein